MLGRLLRYLFVLLLLRLVLRAWAGFVRARSAPARSKPAPRALVRDRVCNTFLPRDVALTARVGGREEHFCSAACRDRALAS